MSKVYVIGSDETNVRKITEEILADNKSAEIIFIKDIEDIPFEERLKSVNPPMIIENYKFINHPDLTSTVFFDKKRKGHERPYKYHR